MGTKDTQAQAARPSWLAKAAIAAFVSACLAIFAFGSWAQPAYADDASSSNTITVQVVNPDDSVESTVDIDLDDLAIDDSEAYAQYYKNGVWTVLYSTSFVTVEDLLDAAQVELGDDDIINFGADDGMNTKWAGDTFSALTTDYKFYTASSVADASAVDESTAQDCTPVVALTYATGTGETIEEAYEAAIKAEQSDDSCPKAFIGISDTSGTGGNRLWSGVTTLQVSRSAAFTISITGSNGGTYLYSQAQLDELTIKDGEAYAQFYKSGWTVLYSTSFVPIEDLLDYYDIELDDDQAITFYASDGAAKLSPTWGQLIDAKFYTKSSVADASAVDEGTAQDCTPVVALTYATGTGETIEEALAAAKQAEQSDDSCPRSLVGIWDTDSIGGNRLWSGIEGFTAVAYVDVDFVTNGGTAVASLEDVAYGTALSSLSVDDPTYDGYFFEGWYCDADCTQAYDDDKGLVAEYDADSDSRSVTLYACWSSESDADDVLDSIDALDSASDTYAADVAAAAAAYEALTDNQKAYIGSDAALALREAQLAAAQAELAALQDSANSTSAELTAVQDDLAAAQAELAALQDSASATSAELKAAAVTSVTVNCKKVTAKKIAAAVEKAGGSSEYVTEITFGKKVKKIGNGALKKYTKVKTINVKTKKLTKKSVKGSLKGSKVASVKVNVGSKATSKTYAKKYAKAFKKANSGKKVVVYSAV